MPASRRGKRLAYLCLFLLGSLGIWAFNHELFWWINGTHAPWLDALMGLIGGFGDGLVVVVLVTSLMLWQLRAGIAGLIAFIASGLIAQVLKHLVHAPRPAAEFQNVHILGQPLTAHSFPSGHATSLGVVFMLAWLVFDSRDWRAWLICFVALLAAYSRVYGGVHFPLDVWVGFGIGIFCMWGIWVFQLRWAQQPWETSSWAWNIPAMMLLVEAAVLGFGYPIQPSTAKPLTLVVSVMALVWLALRWRRRFESKSLF